MRKITRSITSVPTAARSFRLVWLKRFGLAVVVGLLLLAILSPRLAWSQGAQQTSFRLSRLESDMRSLQSQLNQLGGQVDRLQRREELPIAEAQAFDASSEVSPSYDQLATLVIETRQDMFALQAQLAQIKAQLNSTEDSSTEDSL